MKHNAYKVRARRWRRGWAQFRCLGWSRRWLLVEAVGWLGLARLAVLCLPFRWIASWLGSAHAADTAPTLSGDPRLAEEVQWALRVVSRRTPWQSNCLAQAIAGQRMLARRGAATALYMGLRREGPELAAHAWLRSAGVLVCGGPQDESFTVVSTFVFDPGSDV